MSNFDKAVEIIGELATEYGQPGGDELFGLDEDAALALKEAGLLAPDLPEVSKGTPVHWTPEWEKHMEQGAEEAHLDGTNVFLDRSNQKIITLAKGSHIDHYGVGEAKAVALALLAATDYAEKRHFNE